MWDRIFSYFSTPSFQSHKRGNKIKALVGLLYPSSSAVLLSIDHREVVISACIPIVHWQVQAASNPTVHCLTRAACCCTLLLTPLSTPLTLDKLTCDAWRSHKYGNFSSILHRKQRRNKVKFYLYSARLSGKQVTKHTSYDILFNICWVCESCLDISSQY